MWRLTFEQHRNAITDAGGKINHPEFRLDDPPVYDAPRRLR